MLFHITFCLFMLFVPYCLARLEWAYVYNTPKRCTKLLSILLKFWVWNPEKL
jgi:hypothetical protein